MPRRACPERSRRGQPIIAQRFSAGKGGKKGASPGGTTEFPRTLFSPRAISAPPIPTPCHLATTKVLCISSHTRVKRNPTARGPRLCRALFVFGHAAKLGRRDHQPVVILRRALLARRRTYATRRQRHNSCGDSRPRLSRRPRFIGPLPAGRRHHTATSAQPRDRHSVPPRHHESAWHPLARRCTNKPAREGVTACERTIIGGQSCLTNPYTYSAPQHCASRW